MNFLVNRMQSDLQNKIKMILFFLDTTSIY